MRLQKGFTLTELMIVVAIVAILTMIAYPSYARHVAKAKRSAAQSFMLTVANKQEQYMLDARGYSNLLGTLGLTVPPDVDTHYTIAITSASSSVYTITATAKAVQAAQDPNCTSLSLDQAGSRTPATGCW